MILPIQYLRVIAAIQVVVFHAALTANETFGPDRPRLAA
jgi:peptidoglycan/LPS O-acetylase OafA/YrhL